MQFTNLLIFTLASLALAAPPPPQPASPEIANMPPFNPASPTCRSDCSNGLAFCNRFCAGFISGAAQCYNNCYIGYTACVRNCN
ncbi:hypothetical protein BGZ60DRAFT_410403 [Tricladium varicosporioides]|nr:hypothetical protein BGZ60DRAFT_410403 [Hymenoscyphus varicosporioides]